MHTIPILYNRTSTFHTRADRNNRSASGYRLIITSYIYSFEIWIKNIQSWNTKLQFRQIMEKNV